MQLIPSIDVLEGRTVRLRQGRYDDVTTYADPPEEIASAWRGAVERLHVVDLEGARQGKPVQRDVIRKVIRAFGSGTQVGGGVRSMESVESYFDLGVDRVVLGTAAIRDPELVSRAAEKFPGRVIVALDARKGRVATDGWLEVSEKSALDIVRDLAKLPIAAVLYTDIDRDGTEVGPNVAETARLAREGGLPVIASGGVGSLAHLTALAAERVIDAAIVGRALHEERFTLAQAVAAARGAA